MTFVSGKWQEQNVGESRGTVIMFLMKTPIGFLEIQKNTILIDLCLTIKKQVFFFYSNSSLEEGDMLSANNYLLLHSCCIHGTKCGYQCSMFCCFQMNLFHVCFFKFPHCLMTNCGCF